MPGVNGSHPTDFSLFRYTAGDIDEAEREQINRHVESCERCAVALDEICGVDAGLRELADTRPPSPPGEEGLELPRGDPFEKRPHFPERRGERVTPQVADRALAASERATDGVGGLLAAAGGPPEELVRHLGGFSLSDPTARYLLLYALEAMASRLVDEPATCLRFAEETLERLRSESVSGSPSEAETMVPLAMLAGQAHLLAGQTSNWTGELEKGRQHLEEAYRSFSESTDEMRLALTEYHESQRRSFAGKPAEGLLLVRRAIRTLEIYGVEDFVARARVAEGVALSLLGRDEEAIACFRAVTPVFESHGLWKNYVSAVNSLGTSLGQLGRLAEARREYSRALKKVSRKKYPALLAFTRHGLASLLFSAGRYAEAAKAFGQAGALFQDLHQVGDALLSSLYEIESWARSGDAARALHRLEIFRAEVDRREALDPFIVRQLGQALSGREPDFEKASDLRRRAEEMLRENLKAASG
ncbi:MAG TPA: tetratricopeptide repeat protein [Thermoanaerobaculia bacterium]